MADYTTYATLIKEFTPSEIIAPSLQKDGFTTIICHEKDDGFETLLGILNLNIDDLPKIEESYITAEQWREHVCPEYKGNGDLSVKELDWLLTSRLEWKGDECEYFAYQEDPENNPDLHEWVKYGSLEDEYPELAKVVSCRHLKCIAFREHYTGNDKAHYWANWKGQGLLGDLGGVILAKDAAKHIRYNLFLDDFEYAESFVEKAEKFALDHGEDVSVMFGFG